MSDKHDYGLDPLDRAIYETVSEYRHPVSGKRGGVALAPVMGMNQGTLLNKANPNSEYAHLSVKEARQMMLASGDHRILHVLAHEMGEACVPLPTLEFPADADLLEAWAEWQAEVARTVQAMRNTLADGKVTKGEVRAVRNSLVQDLEKGLAMLDVLDGMAEPETTVVPLTGAKR